MPDAKLLALLLTSLTAVARAEPPAPPTPTTTEPAQPAGVAQPDPPPPTPVPPTPSPAAAAAQPSPAAAAVAAPPPSPAASGVARVRFAVNHPDAWLETRPFGTEDAWRPSCKAPCGQWLSVEDVEVRVTAASMTPSAAFRIDPGQGSALLKVSGGSSLARQLGRIGLIAGLPISLLGMTGFAYGHFDERRSLETVGAISLGLGAALVLTALPLLVAGSTSVRNGQGELIAAGSRANPL